MTPYYGFAIDANRILREILTECGILAGFDHTKISGAHPLPVSYKALWDTGANGTVVSEKIVKDLGLKPVGKTKCYHANGESIVNEYIINLYLPNKVAIPLLRVTEGSLTAGFDVLIGMDVITQGDLMISNFNGKTKFSFRIPSVESLSFNIDDKASGDTVKTTVSRNSPCPCGSGKLYKRCHGA